MKKILLVAAAAAGLVSIAPAFAADGTINITGNVTTTACKVTTTTGINVVLPTVTTAALASAGATAGNQPFAINLTLCPANTTVSTYFEPGANVDTATGNLKNTASGGAGNVQVALYNSDSTKINLNNVAGSQNSKSATISGAGAMNYFAAYIANGAAATAGAVSTSVVFTMQYQ
ncbi:MAG TPA: fimbrial protein [Lysobacter sp.]